LKVGVVGFIGYLHEREGRDDEVVRIFLECREDKSHDPGKDPSGKPPLGVCYTNAVDVVFPSGKHPCCLRGVDGILVLKKFYKLISSLEERAREHGNDRQKVLESVESLLEHLTYTRNARDFTGLEEPRPDRSATEL
jgi:hypothetical protein